MAPEDDPRDDEPFDKEEYERWLDEQNAAMERAYQIEESVEDMKREPPT